MGFSALVGGLIGSRLDFIIENYSDVKHDLFGNLFSGSGLVWYGGAIGGAIGVLLWAWWRGFLDPRAARRRRPGAGPRLRDRPLRLPALRRRRLRQGLGRALGDGLSRRHQADRPTVHPTPVYETLAMGLVALVLWRLRDRFTNGTLFALYLLLAGHRALPGRVHPPQRRRRPRPHPGAAAQPGDDDRRRGLAAASRTGATLDPATA